MDTWNDKHNPPPTACTWKGMLKESLFLAGRFCSKKAEEDQADKQVQHMNQKNVSNAILVAKNKTTFQYIHFKLSGGAWVHQHATEKSFPFQLKLASSKGIQKKTKNKNGLKLKLLPLLKQFTATIFYLFFPEETTEKRLFLVWFLILIPNPTEKDPRPSCWSHSRTRKRLSQPNGKGFLGWEIAALRGWQFSGSCTFHQKYWESRWGYIWTCQYLIYMSYMAEMQYFTNLESLK